ncbi:or 3'-5' exonuclease KapD [Bacillus canaveralius]|uniref:Or 3'-5' exonuclease KapD n=1 Tax=Bacillus canaveralius TaxID=1403243 RepID=A0A2N5GLY4_9BACI|nr:MULTISPECIES: 3'-5' exonuclease KapD [Bacillus]PLR82823.1 or 3'-5' exonuclease KapD [Bacillus canaveralius]PLR85193.1 or 3'-5' exonuclease KapD [Bacillus sp. V33-4]PLR97172.1 or 3'-5' exonuclease KapD [Bacillus canaveralius]RSK49773.1 3'-5' exonuclease KapD [Bacillus canaveralius]
MKEKHRYLFIDFEFTMPDRKGKLTGFYPEIIEAGIVIVEEENIFEKFSSFVIPLRFPKLTDRCKSFLHISQAQVNQGVSFYELIKKLEHLDRGASSTVVTWGNMDMRVLRQNCAKAGLPFPFSGKEIDLSMEYKQFFGDQNQTGLWKAVQEYGKEGTGKHHRALDDAMTTYSIFRLVEKDKQYLQKPTPTTIGDRVDFSKLLNKFA